VRAFVPPFTQSPLQQRLSRIGEIMASLTSLMDSARALRDALYERLDDNISDRSFELLRFRHTQAVMEVRRTDLPGSSGKFDAVIASLDAATTAVSSASNSDGPIAAAAATAGEALDMMIAL
jgi:hypothetical protein